MNLSGKSIVIGVSGGIAVYKVCSVVSALRKAGAQVFVAMTKNATEFVSPLTFETLSNNRVTVDTFDRDFEWEVEHISLAKRADLFVVAPMTANFAGKLARGIADDFLSTTAMVMTCPILLAPAMNTNMLNSKAYRENEKILSERGAQFVYGGSGFLACGDNGDGRLAEPDQIVKKIYEMLTPNPDYDGKTVLITAGGTSEPIDPVRFIGNRSSGKMGVALAQKALDRGAKVILITGNISVPTPKGAEIIKVETTAQMYDAVMQNYARADIIIKSAAPADYRVEKVADNKIKATELNLKLVKNPDIAQSVGEVKGDKKLIIFSAETENLIENATAKLIKKHADMVVANNVTQVGAGFNGDTNIVTLITPSEVTPLPLLSKAEVADKILDKAIKL